MTKLNVAVLYGGRAPEHEVSIITALQVMAALDSSKYSPIPIYITKKGDWITGGSNFFDPKSYKDLNKIEESGKKIVFPTSPEEQRIMLTPGAFAFGSLFTDKIDVAFPCFHGKYGEDGSIQGLFELANIPYVGCKVQASALGMNKYLSKKLASNLGINVTKDYLVHLKDWEENKTKVINEINKLLKLPYYVKPVHLGSSIGITRVSKKSELNDALDVGFYYDHEVLVEEAVVKAREANISIIGNNPYELSSTEEPIASSETLSFEDKYISDEGTSKGMATTKRIVPAPIEKKTKETIEEYSRKFFAEIGGTGIARIDYLLDSKEKVYFNEINTMPGSVAFYLWKAREINFPKLCDKLIKFALERHKAEGKVTTVFQSNILAGFQGGKGGKF